MRTWGKLTIPLDGGLGWTRVDVAELDLGDVDWIEVHAFSEKPGLRLWLGDLRFNSVTFPAIDPNLRAARWSLGLGDWLDLRDKRRTEVDSPVAQPAPFKLRSIFLSGGSNPGSVTDDVLENLESVGMREPSLWETVAITDKGLIHLKGLF